MARQIESFKKDWQRWSRKERYVALTLGGIVLLLLGGPLSSIL